jgi:hypothetical protein
MVGDNKRNRATRSQSACYHSRHLIPLACSFATPYPPIWRVAGQFCVRAEEGVTCVSPTRDPRARLAHPPIHLKI